MRPTIAIAGLCGLLLTGSQASAGQWKYGYSAAANMFDFDVGNGTLYWVNYAGGSPAYYDGTIACGSGTWITVSHTNSCNFDAGLTFPHGHAERVAVGAAPERAPYWMDFVATAEGQLWAYAQYYGSWYSIVNLPAGLPTGVGSYGVLRLIYEQLSNATNQQPANPIWLLGSDHHIYHLTGSGSPLGGGGLNLGTTWVDVSNAYGLGAVSQLSYSRMYDAVICTWSDGTSAYFNENYNTWYYVTGSAPIGIPHFGVQSVASYSTVSPAFGTGGLFQAWNLDPPLTAAGNFTTAFMIGINGTWYDISTNPAIPGYPAITGATYIDVGASGSWYDNLNYNFSAAVAGLPDEEVPISIVEGSYLSESSYTGGPHDTGYNDLFWVLTNHLRMYFYEE